MTNLVIVESAAKAKTIAKYLNSIPELKEYGRFEVMACLGHVLDLPRKEMGIDTKTWDMALEPIAGKEAVIAKMKKAVKAADRVFLASDPDREGAAIAAHLLKVLKLGDGGGASGRTKRVVFHEITKDALKRAILNPVDIDRNMVASQEARRILDRVVGYELSPLLWRRFATSQLSAGRVQSAALRMMVDRAKEAAAATEKEPQMFWTMSGVFSLQDPEARLEGKAYLAKQGSSMATWTDAAVVKGLLAVGKEERVWRGQVSQKEAHKNPSAPFTTSALQQEAYTRLGIPAKRTMQLAQGLYEAGHITYMRTDSVALSEEAQKAILGYVTETYGGGMAVARTFATKNSHAQEAHECIRPTDVGVVAGGLEGDWSPSHRKVYDLIWRRAVASQMKAATYAEVNFEMVSEVAKWKGVVFRGKQPVLIDEGYLKVYQPDAKAKPEDLKAWEALLAKGQVNAKIDVLRAEGDVERPPSLYHEPSLIKAMEKQGIGRPSTYTTILEKLYQKGYVSNGTNPQRVVRVVHYQWEKRSTKGVTEEEDTVLLGGKETDRMVPTGLGTRVVEYLQEVAPEMLDIGFTAEMEGSLDRIADGKIKKERMLEHFYKGFHGAVEKAEATQKEIAKEKAKERREAKKKAKENGEVDAKGASGDPEITPKSENVLREFNAQGAQLIKTRFGPALLHTATSRWVGVMPLLQWREKTIEELTGIDVAFLLSLPREIPNADGWTLVMGRYGLYLTRGEGDAKENLHLPKDLWDKAYEGKIRASDLPSPSEAKKPGKSKFGRGRFTKKGVPKA